MKQKQSNLGLHCLFSRQLVFKVLEHLQFYILSPCCEGVENSLCPDVMRCSFVALGTCFCLFDLVLYVPSTISYVGTGLPGLKQY